MSKTYDQILKSKMEGMESAPPSELWSKIQNNIPSAQATSAFDQVVNQKVANINTPPPANLWKKIATSLQPTIPFYKTVFFRSAAAILIILGTVTSIYLINQENKESAILTDSFTTTKEISQPNSDIQGPNSSQTPIASEIQKTNNSTVTNSNSSDIEIQKNNSEPSYQSNGSFAKEEISNIAKTNTPISIEVINSQQENIELAHENQNIPIILQEKIEIENQSNISIITEQPIDNKSEKSISKIELQTKNKPNNPVVSDSTQKETPDQISEDKSPAIANITTEDPKRLPKNPRNLNKYGLSFHYIPSQLNTSINPLNHQDFNFSFSYQNINFYTNLGLGFGFSSETAEYKIDYSRYEFVKVQFITDSLGFTYDASTQTYTPVAIGHHENVYDDVDYTYSAEATTRNYWINIPLNFGYIKDYKRFSLMAGAGINYAVVIATQTIDLFEPDNQSTIQNFYYPVHTRVNSNISYNLTSGIAMKMTEQLKLSGEIYGVYYQNPIYEDVDNRAFGYGLKLGLIYYFR